MQKYTKVYTRENTLFSIQAWEEHQCHRVEKYLGQNVPLSIFDAHNGVVSVYYHENISEIWSNLILKKAEEDSSAIESLMNLYALQIDKLEEIWKRGMVNSKEELVEFFDSMAEAWIGLSVSYTLPDIKNLSKEFQDLGMTLRKRSADFLDASDKVVYKSLKQLYPELNDLVRYISIEEIRSNTLPSVETLEERQKHYIYFNFEVITGVDAQSIAEKNDIEIVEEKVPENITELRGQTAMQGKVGGKVRVLQSKAQIKELLEGEILVIAMTTPDYLPAMNKAAAFVTDEGGITCHAAIVAREMGKPCIIGTKIATKVLKTGDEVEVDADNGVVRIKK